MQQNNKRRKANWSSAIGWLIFILVILGSRLPSIVQSLSGGAITLPSNLLPMLIGGLVALSVLVSVVRSVGGSRARQSDTRLPTGSPTPPFAGPAGPALPPSASLPRPYLPASGDGRLPSAPRFEPVINPKILAFGIVGVLVLAGAALLVFGLLLP